MIRHRFVSPKADGADDTLARPSDWNATHKAPGWAVTLVGASTTWTNMPAALTEFTGSPRTRYDLTDADDVRLVVCVGVAGQGGATLKAQYSTDQSNWSDLTGAAAADALNVQTTAWAAVPAGAKGDVFIRLVGQGGNGTLDPQFRLVQLQVR